MRIVFATAEFAPVARVGGLAAATAGLVKALRAAGEDVEVVLPDYFATPLTDETAIELSVPEWAGPVRARAGTIDGVGAITLIDAHGVRRSHPYVQPDGSGWPDNDRRFFAFSAAVAALVQHRRPDVVHLNDWHTAATLAFIAELPPTVLTIHTLGYQGQTNRGWLDAFPHHREAFDHGFACNPLAGAIRLADRVVAVSPTYARESITPAGGFGLDAVLRDRGESFIGIRNGIDTEEWDPSTDAHIAHTFRQGAMQGKEADRAALREEMGLEPGADALLVMVTRLVEQKGVDLALAVVPFLATARLQLAVLGSGDRHLVDALRQAEVTHPGRVAFHDGYDEGLAHRLFAGGDLFIMPSRFEPCGLAQMQAMRYGTLPVVTDVGGLHDTVIDIDREPSRGTGIVATDVSELGVVDAVHRAARASANVQRRNSMRRRGMTTDWSWTQPAAEHISLYNAISS
jgi:starch synthase